MLFKYTYSRDVVFYAKNKQQAEQILDEMVYEDMQQHIDIGVYDEDTKRMQEITQLYDIPSTWDICWEPLNTNGLSIENEIKKKSKKE